MPLVLLTGPACGVVLHRDTRLGQDVEKRGFAHVGQTHDATLQTYQIPLENGRQV